MPHCVNPGYVQHGGTGTCWSGGGQPGCAGAVCFPWCVCACWFVQRARASTWLVFCLLTPLAAALQQAGATPAATTTGVEHFHQIYHGCLPVQPYPHQCGCGSASVQEFTRPLFT